jgi:hypothetical protein
MAAMPARSEPAVTARSRFAPLCARWLRRGFLVAAASLLAVACVLNPKTDDLPGNVNGGPPLFSGPSSPTDPSQGAPGATPDLPNFEDDGGEQGTASPPEPEPRPPPASDDAGVDFSSDAGIDAE